MAFAILFLVPCAMLSGRQGKEFLGNDLALAGLGIQLKAASHAIA
jgi:hypothetical protein